MSERRPLDPERRSAVLSMAGKGPGRAWRYPCRENLAIVV
jgi:hypothetical protein